MESKTDTPDHEVVPAAPLVLRGVMGGVLMGLANLVPGISGGTMLVSAGVYPRFVAAVAEITRLRFRLLSILLLGAVGVSALVSILLFAGVVKDLVVDHRWVMYSLFIGLTLGGLPVVWRMAKTATTSLWLGAAGGFLVMVVVAFVKSGGESGAHDAGWPLLFVAGLAGASAMILPGISGGYLLLLMGLYVPILSGIDAFKEALRAGDLAAAMGPAFGVILPVGLGVVVGIVAVSNAIRWLLLHYEKATLGVLIGLLLGAVLGIWPFQQSVPPVPGQTVIKGQLVTEANLADFAQEDFPTAYFTPTPGQVAASAGLILLGLAVTSLVAHLGREPDKPAPTVS